MNIIKALKQLRDDIKTWVTNNLNELNKRLTQSINNIPKFSGNYNDLTDAPNIIEDESGNMVIADELGNIIFKADSDGIHTTAVSLNGEAAASEKYVDEAIANNVFSGNYKDLTDAPNIAEDESGNMVIADELGNIIFKADSDGIHTTAVSLNGEAAASEKYVDEAIANNVPKGYATENFVTDAIKSAKEELSESIVAESEDLKVVDGNGNIILSVDKYGTHTTYLMSHGVSAEFVMISDDIGDKGGYIEYQDNEGDAAALAFAGARGDEPVILRRIANPITDDDAANKLYVDSKVSGYIRPKGIHTQYISISDPSDDNGAYIQWRKNSDDYAFLELAGVLGDEPVILRGIGAPLTNGDAANKEYVDSKVSEYLPLSGGTITGDVELPGGKILLGNSIMRTAEWVDGNYGQSPFKIFTDQENYEYTIGGGRIGGLTMPPSNDTDAANKAYVDDAINEALEDIGADGGAGGSMVDIDATLSIPGAAADAKAVGNALGDKLDKTGGTISGRLGVTGDLKVAGVTNFRNLMITDRNGAPAVGMRAGGWVDGPEYGFAGVLHCHSETDIEQPIIIRGVMNPIQNDDVTNKAYVDDAINAAKEDFSESVVSESEAFKIVDEVGNIIFGIDANGVHTTSLTLNGERMEDLINKMIDARIQYYIDKGILVGA